MKFTVKSLKLTLALTLMLVTAGGVFAANTGFNEETLMLEADLAHLEATDRSIEKENIFPEKHSKEITSVKAHLASTAQGPGTLGIPAFAWGFILSFIGVVAVYFLANDRVATRQAFFGALSGAVVIAILYFFVFGN